MKIKSILLSIILLILMGGCSTSSSFNWDETIETLRNNYFAYNDIVGSNLDALNFSLKTTLEDDIDSDFKITKAVNIYNVILEEVGEIYQFETNEQANTINEALIENLMVPSDFTSKVIDNRIYQSADSYLDELLGITFENKQIPAFDWYGSISKLANNGYNISGQDQNRLRNQIEILNDMYGENVEFEFNNIDCITIISPEFGPICQVYKFETSEQANFIYETYNNGESIPLDYLYKPKVFDNIVYCSFDNADLDNFLGITAK